MWILWNCTILEISLLNKGELIAGTVIDCKINPQFDLTSSQVRQEVATLIEREDPLVPHRGTSMYSVLINAEY